jgi:hypothetical protein
MANRLFSGKYEKSIKFYMETKKSDIEIVPEKLGSMILVI